MARRVLLGRLADGIRTDRRLTIIAAVGGMSKTALLSEYAAFRGATTTYVALTASQRDPADLAATIATALCAHIPRASSGAEA